MQKLSKHTVHMVYTHMINIACGSVSRSARLSSTEAVLRNGTASTKFPTLSRATTGWDTTTSEA